MARRIRSQKELIKKRLEAQKFLKDEPISNFYTVKDIAKRFDLSEYFVMKNLIQFFPITTEEEYYDTENDILYCSRIRIAELLGVYETFLVKILKHPKINPIKIRFVGERKKSSVKYYYNIEKDITYFPEKYQRIYSFHHINNLPAEIYRSTPENFEDYEFFTFCCLILYKIQNDIWANLSQIQVALKKSFNIYYSISRISSALGKFEKHNYLKRIKTPRSMDTIYKIIQAPFCLTHRLTKCVSPYTQQEYFMYAPYDFFIGKL